jgi:hypothetical protein
MLGGIAPPPQPSRHGPADRHDVTSSLYPGGQHEPAATEMPITAARGTAAATGKCNEDDVGALSG